MFDAYEAHIDGMHAFLLKEKIPIFLILLSNVENASFTRLIDSLQFGNKAHSTFTQVSDLDFEVEFIV